VSALLPFLPAGIYKALRGHIPELLRHPAGCHVADDLHHAATPAQRASMAAGALSPLLEMAQQRPAAAAALCLLLLLILPAHSTSSHLLALLSS
jgi:hypothetical protein